MSINLYAPINPTGYGIASLNILKNLTLYSDIKYFPIHNPSVTNQEDYDTILSILNNSIDFNPNDPCLKIWHQFDLASRIGNGRYYAYPFFELDTLNILEQKHLSVPDELFVSSEWAKNVLVANGVYQPINIAPLGVDRNIFNDSIEISDLPPKQKYIFLTIGKWEVRKAHDILPKLFKLAFPTEQDVELWIVASEQSSYSSKEDIQKWKGLYGDDVRLKVIPGTDTQEDLAKLIKQSDCGIYISRAEGWNMELLETMAMNKPAIATFYSAHTEFCNPQNSYLVDITETEKAYDGKAFTGQGNWAKIGQTQIEQTIDYMRHVYKNNINTNNAGLDTAKLLSWQNTAQIISGCILN
jgi:glycosyltransferase involved in cell wall biosynthesis